MPPTLHDEIRELRARFWSDRDPEGRAFAPLAERYRRAGDLDQATALVNDGLERLPDFPPGHLVSARILRDRGDAGGAGRAYERVLELDPGNAEALLEAGELAEASGDLPGALRLLQRLLRLDPDDGELRARVRELKALHYGIGEPGPAPSEAFRPAPSEEPRPAPFPEPRIGDEPDPSEEPEVYTRTMAELYVRQGLEERAVEVYRHLVEASPDDEELRARLRELDPGPSGPTAASYFSRMLEWSEAVPVENLAPDRAESVDGPDGIPGGERGSP